MNQQKIGEFIAEIRKSKNMTQSDLAQKMSVSINAVSKWERGLSMPDVSLLKPLSEELGITINELLSGEKILDQDLIVKSDQTILNTIHYKDQEKRKVIIQLVVCTIAFIIFLLGLSIWNFFIRGAVDNYVSYNIKESNESIYISGNLLNDEKVFNKAHVEIENGVMHIIPYSSYESIFNKNNSFNINYSLKNINQIYFADELVWQDGKIISSIANDLFKNKNPYVGNMSANGRIANILSISTILGNYKNSLITSKQPYEWNFIFEENYTLEDSTFLDKKMNQYSILLLSLIDNLSVVTWTFSDGSNTYQKSIDIEEANEQIKILKGTELPDGVKEYSVSAYLINELLTMLHL